MFSGIENSVNKAAENVKQGLNTAAKTISKEVVHISKSAEKKISDISNTPLLASFKTDNIVQLISRSSGKTLQLVFERDGGVALNGLGPDTETVHNKWNCINEGSGSHIVHLYNENYFIAIKNGRTYLVHYDVVKKAGPETRLKIVQMDQNFVCLMSVAEAERHVGVLPTGELKPSIATGKENDAQFGVRVVFTAVNPSSSSKT